MGDGVSDEQKVEVLERYRSIGATEERTACAELVRAAGSKEDLIHVRALLEKLACAIEARGKE